MSNYYADCCSSVNSGASPIGDFQDAVANVLPMMDKVF
jgi:hypothetical protein